DSGDAFDRAAASEDALGVVGMEPHAFPVRRAQLPWLLPRPGRDTDTAEVVQQRRQVQVCRLLLAQSDARRSLTCQACHAGRMADRERALEVRHVSERLRDLLHSALARAPARLGLLL